jgi:hypothetical protein
MKIICAIICGASLIGCAVLGQDQLPVKTGVEAAGAASLVAYQTAMGRADVAVAKSLLNERILKGEVGEAIRDQTFGRYLLQNGQWLNVSPRLGPQGLDHISVQLDENGVPRRMMVDETKFGSSRLSVTKSGDVQMGNKWVSDRLSGLATRFDTIREQAQGGSIKSGKVTPQLSSKRIVSVPLSDSESVVFWRPAEGAGSWCYDGPTELLPKAIVQLKNMSLLFRAGANGKIDFPKRIFQVKIKGDILKVNILDATAVDASGGIIGKLPVNAEIELPLERTIWASDTIAANIAEDLRRQMPYLDSAEARRLAQGIQSTAVDAEDALVGSSFRRFAAFQTANVGTAGVFITVPIEIAIQLYGGAPVDWSRVAGVGGLAGGSAVVGSWAGNGTTWLLMRNEVGSASTTAAKFLGLGSASRFANLAGGTVGGGATAILFSYGGYWLGYYDLQTANRSAVAGSIGFTAGRLYVAYSVTEGASEAAAEGGVLTVEAATGAEFSEFGPVEWIATGITIAVTAPAMYGFQVWDEHEENIRLSKTIEYLSAKKTFFTPEAQYDGVSH